MSQKPSYSQGFSSSCILSERAAKQPERRHGIKVMNPLRKRPPTIKRLYFASAIAVAVIGGLLTAACGARAISAARLTAALLATESPAPADVESRPHPFTGYAGSYAADLYLPVAEDAPGLLLVPGASRAGKEDPRLVRFARQLAGAGFVVLVPEIENFKALQPRAEDAQSIADAVVELSGLRPQGRIGIAAISYAAGPAILAALRPEIGEKVDFLLAIGPYHDVNAYLTYVTTGFYRAVGSSEWLWQRPNTYGRWVFVQANASLMENRVDAALLSGMALRRLRDPNAPLDDLIQRLGSEGSSVLALLENKEPERVPHLIGGLSERLRAELKALDLSRQELGNLRSRLILVHGRDDTVVPYTESVSLAAAIQPDKVDLFILDQMRHVETDLGQLRDLLRLYSAVWTLLATSEALPALPIGELRARPLTPKSGSSS